MCKQILPIRTIRNIWRTVRRKYVLILGNRDVQIITTEVFKGTANFVRDNRDQKQCIKQIHFIWPRVSTLITRK